MSAGAHARLRPGTVGVEPGGEIHQLGRGRVDAGREHADALLKLHTCGILHRHMIANKCSLHNPERWPGGGFAKGDRNN